MAGRNLPALAVHVGADVLSSPRHHALQEMRFCRRTIGRFRGICRAVGIAEQLTLVGDQATRGQVCTALADAAARLDRRGLLVLTFAGHSERGSPGAGWCLFDGPLRLAELRRLLRAVPASANALVVADTCYGSALARFADVPCTLALLASCGAGQTTLDRPVNDFVDRLEQLVVRDGKRNRECSSYLWLKDRLRADTPDVERPEVCVNRADGWHHRPFDMP